MAYDIYGLQLFRIIHIRNVLNVIRWNMSLFDPHLNGGTMSITKIAVTPETMLLMTDFQRKYPKATKDRLFKQIIQAVIDEERTRILKALKQMKFDPLPGSGE